MSDTHCKRRMDGGEGDGGDGVGVVVVVDRGGDEWELYCKDVGVAGDDRWGLRWRRW